jgi:hypothetical protein
MMASLSYSRDRSFRYADHDDDSRYSIISRRMEAYESERQNEAAGNNKRQKSGLPLDYCT